MTDPHPSIDLFGVAWRLGATVFFVLLNGFFVAAEFALVKAREPRIAQLGRDGSRAAPAVQHILRHLDRYLSACQLGITLASLILGALGEPAVSVLLIAAAGGVGLPIAEDAGWVSFVSIGLAFAVITVLHMTVGEQAPKMWALRRAEKMALATAPPLRAFTWLFGPFIHMINWISNGLLKLIGLPPELGHETSHSSEEIRSILSLSARAGKISDHEYELSENVFRIIDLEVRHIVVPRIEVDFLIAGNPLEENLEHIRTGGHSRFALCELGLDTIIGIVHSRDVLDATLRGETPDLRAIARPPVFVSDTMSISNFLRELQQHRQQCAVVLDEHGTAIGLAFREDALEEIVGPLGDEFDSEDADFVELSEGIYEVSGRMPLPELEDRLDFDLPEEEAEEEDSIGGHVTARLGRLPRKGDEVRVGPYLATVIDSSRRRAHKLRVALAPPEVDEAADEGSQSAT
ncbi:MAG: HlyC/CorC family transporter [Deltaproteobacteria bacterium]|nr:HlyC/CorC family transporter [Deltaproteobacteria bacterium]